LFPSEINNSNSEVRAKLSLPHCTAVMMYYSLALIKSLFIHRQNDINIQI